MSRWLQLLDPVLRERLLLVAGVVFLLLLFALVWIPLADARDALRPRVQRQQATLQFVETAAARLRTSSGHSKQAATIGDRSLLTLVDASIRAEGLSESLNRAEPQSAGRVRVWLDAAPFDATVAWFENLNQRYGVQVRELSVDRAGGPGMVNVRVVLDAS